VYKQTSLCIGTNIENCKVRKIGRDRKIKRYEEKKKKDRKKYRKIEI